ncbi:MAG: chemotaxis protein CheB [Chloroflexi bacterium]|nr:chemotaxis protein CheB [Chloroflexota bacterium]
MSFGVVVVGTSLGGLQALKTFLNGLPTHFPLPVAVVQHQGSDATGDLSRLLQRYSALRVADAEDKETLVPGRVYVAPVGYHLLLEPGSIALSTDAPVWFARPSIDVLFESAADSYGARAIGVILTGASSDGAAGLAAIKAQGGMAIVQDPDEAESRIMPAAAIAGTTVDRVLRLSEIAPYLNSLSGTPMRG